MRGGRCRIREYGIEMGGEAVGRVVGGMMCEFLSVVRNSTVWSAGGGREFGSWNRRWLAGALCGGRTV